jgi:hypothetical protein
MHIIGIFLYIISQYNVDAFQCIIHVYIIMLVKLKGYQYHHWRTYGQHGSKLKHKGLGIALCFGNVFWACYKIELSYLFLTVNTPSI